MKFNLELDFCPCCGNPGKVLYIGELKKGYIFCFDKSIIRSVKEWLYILKEVGKIVDEKGNTYAFDEFMNLINSTKKDKKVEESTIEEGFCIK